MDQRWHADCKSGTWPRAAGVAPAAVGRALPEPVAAVIDPHVVAEVADRSKMEAVDVERWRPGREAFDEVRSCAAMSRGDSHRRSMGGCWKDQVLPDSERPPALPRERCAADGRSGRSPFFRRVPNDAARHPSVICRPRSLPSSLVDSTISSSRKARLPCCAASKFASSTDGSRLALDLDSANFRYACVTADTIDDIPGHFASLDVAQLRLLLRDRYKVACDADDMVRTLKRSSAAESPTNEAPIHLWIVVIAVAKETKVLL